MSKILVIILLGIALAGCAGKPDFIVQDKYTVVAPPESLYRCPQLANLPDPETLTEVQVARLVQKLQKDNKICGVSIQALKRFYQNAKKRFQT